MENPFYLISALALAALVFGGPYVCAQASIARSRRQMWLTDNPRAPKPGITFFVPKIMAKLRWGHAAIFERVVEQYGFGEGRKVLATGTIIWIARNTHKALLPHFPEDEICLLIEYDADSNDRAGRSWQPADAYQRSTEGEHNGRVIRIR